MEKYIERLKIYCYNNIKTAFSIMKPVFKNRGELDSLITHIGGEKKKQEKVLEKQFERILHLSESNPYLLDVKKESEEYLLDRNNDREKEIKHLETLLDYINRIIESGTVNETERIGSLKHEKKRITREIKIIKNRLK